MAYWREGSNNEKQESIIIIFSGIAFDDRLKLYGISTAK